MIVVSRYLTARRRWKAAGRPVRSDANVEALLSICQACPHARRDRRGLAKACGICGCRVNRRQFVNKLRWATGSCPANHPRW